MIMNQNKIERELERYIWNTEYQIIGKSEKTNIVVFPKCTLKFYHNTSYKSIECEIANPLNLEQKYDLDEVLRVHNYDVSSLLCNHDEANISEYIEQFVFVINNNLLDVIRGDFEWSERVDDIRTNTNYIYNVLIKTSMLDNTSIFETSIYKKMLIDDLTWKEDLKMIESENFNMGNNNKKE